GEDANVRAADENFLTKVGLEPVHHADDHDERTHGDRHPADRDQADERHEPRAPPASEISPRNRQLQPRHHSGRSVGKRITSRMFGVFVRYMNRRSMPIPTPPIGGMPYSMARR